MSASVIITARRLAIRFVVIAASSSESVGRLFNNVD